jgi:hypothetical protein
VALYGDSYSLPVNDAEDVEAVPDREDRSPVSLKKQEESEAETTSITSNDSDEKIENSYLTHSHALARAGLWNPCQVVGRYSSSLGTVAEEAVDEVSDVNPIITPDTRLSRTMISTSSISISLSTEISSINTHRTSIAGVGQSLSFQSRPSSDSLVHSQYPIESATIPSNPHHELAGDKRQSNAFLMQALGQENAEADESIVVP